LAVETAGTPSVGPTPSAGTATAAVASSRITLKVELVRLPPW
jgi:hypothetical protein